MQRILKYKDDQLRYTFSYTFHYLLQWKPINTVTNGPKKFGRINGWVFLQENVWSFRREAKNESGRNNEVTVLPR